MIANTYLAEVDEPSTVDAAGECLVVFLDAHDAAPTCLTDPEVVGFRPALGHWCLLGVDPECGRAFYARFEHTPPLACEPARPQS